MTADPATLPITVLTGFLGSGKTTFLQRALADAALADTAVLVNELGEIGLDHHLVETVDGPLLELPGGCLCCAIREDLATTLRDLLDRRAAGTVTPFRRIVIETTGLADPAPILYTLGADPMLDATLHLARVVTTVDALTGAASLARFPEAARQAALADRLLITKTDLAAVDAGLLAQLDGLNAGAPRLRAPGEGDPAAILFGGAAVARPAVSSDAPAQHSHGIATYAIGLAQPCSRLDFARALGGLAGARGEDLLRVKGLVAFTDRPGRPAVIQGAQHAIYPPTWLDGWPENRAATPPGGWLVFIVAGIPRAEILAHFAFAGATSWDDPAAPRPHHPHHHPIGA